MIRVALIGNMNNNHFSILRYLRDLNIDAHLFLYKNEFAHFKPENDTWDIYKWQSYIHNLGFSNNAMDVLTYSKNKIKKEFQDFDITIGCGYAPAYFKKAGLRLDIFLPYNVSIEGTAPVSLLKAKSLNVLKIKLGQLLIRTKQIKGVRACYSIITLPIDPLTRNAIENLQINTINLPLLMVYEEDIQKEHLNGLQKYIDVIKGKSIVVFSHTRHIWKTLKTYSDFLCGGKKNNILIEGFANFVYQFKNPDALLVLFEYGDDVDASKELIRELKIEENVVWFPIMPRKQIMKLIEYCDIVAAEFGLDFWGGVGWETFSKGKILMQKVGISKELYESIANHPMPFFLNVSSAEDICDHLVKYSNDTDYYKNKSRENKAWFDKYAGVGLARKYVEIIKEIYEVKQVGQNS